MKIFILGMFSTITALVALPLHAKEPAITNVGLPAERQPFPNWLAGCHLETKGDRWTEECWTAPRAGIMLGSGCNGRGEKLGSWEVMRIERGADGVLTFWGSPMGAKPVPFRTISVTTTEIVFANPAHDYPQRIRYWRDGKALRAETSLSDGSKAMRWTYGEIR